MVVKEGVHVAQKSLVQTLVTILMQFPNDLMKPNFILRLKFEGATSSITM